tara:strand:- start:1718 stop:3538 length:1821 start_codon:yes stop_codon:yes gene_type:complete
MMPLLLAGMSCISHAELKPRDLPPVTWKKAPAHPPVEVVRDGRARAVVCVADPAPSPKLERLVDELIEVIRLSSGAELERVKKATPSDQPAIFIGDCEAAREAGIDAVKIPIEGFVIKTARNRVFLVGSTVALPAGSGQWSNEGTAWAVADFLERFVGVRWYWPSALGGRTVMPSASLVIPPVHYGDQPVFRLRDYYPGKGWTLPAKARHSDKAPLPFAPDAIPEGVTRVDMGGFLPLLRAGNSWPYTIQVHEPQNLHRLGKSFHEENQEMFARNGDGTRNVRMFCYSSAKALNYLLDGCERVWEKGGRASWVTSTCVTVSPGDEAVICSCPDCRKTVAEAGGDWVDGGSLVMAKFVQRMCEAVKHRWPGKKVIYLPYWNYDTFCPEMNYPDNLVIMSAMTTYPMPLKTQRGNFEEAIQRLRDFRTQSSVPVTTWDYSVAWTYGPYQYPHVLRDYYKAVKGLSAGTYVNGLHLGEWTNTGPTMYLWMRLLWNPNLDVDAVLDEMCKRLYGKAGGTARELIRLQCTLWQNGPWKNRRVKDRGAWPVPAHLFPQVWTPDVTQRLKVLHDQALTELAGDPLARQRFLYWNWSFDAFVKEAETLHGKKVE